ncbi:DUF599 domain-containing protein [Noviherbaspirillum galbum]|uniref:DUF599 domain-containing protein n=1 Tax=Noviherbaspirillum galbum TaxID=2709383 RepID=A0A6B3SIS1_9BURK|nr:DUF599 domain-containing protein [Noviherbaspirillum galbum]NEX60488.1 DUF599 domain-containing protein [Noviherbaspirillum galbum]
MSELAQELLAVAFSLALLAGYYAFLVRQVRRDPDYTIHAINQRARQVWVAEVMRNSSKDIMAVQALRNYVMAATFKASSAVLLIIGTLTLSGQAENLSHTWHVFDGAAGPAPAWWVTKVVCLLTVLIVAFFAFAMTVRILNHVVFMISIPAAEANGQLAPERVAARLNRAGKCYSVGMRAYFTTVPLVFWLFGPGLLVLASIGLVLALYILDRNPAR